MAEMILLMFDQSGGGNEGCVLLSLEHVLTREH